MGTYYHLLGRKELPALPTRIMLLDCQPEINYVQGLPRRHRHTLRTGTLICIDYRHGLPVRRRVYRFTNAAQFIEPFMREMQPRGTTWLVSHNLSYDLALSGFWDIVQAGGLALDSYVINDPPSIIRGHTARGRVVCVDLLNYFRKPLAWTAEAFSHRLSNYCVESNDISQCVSVSEEHCHVVALAISGIVSMLRDCMRGGWGPTAGSISWNIYRARRWGDRIRVHANEEATDLERSSYAGGRVICRANGRIEDTVTILDCNNLYGFCMRENAYPVRLLSVSRANPCQLRAAIVGGRGVVARVRVRAGAPCVLVKVDERSQYTDEATWCTLCGPDLRQCYEAGKIIDAGTYATYRNANPFETYIDYWYNRRLEMRADNRKVEAAVCKLITSSLYGRLAMKGKRWVPAPDEVAPYPYHVWHSPNANGKGWHTCRAVDSLCQHEVSCGESPHSAVAIAAYVTAYGRQHMNYLRDVAGIENVLYEDTDSLHVLNAGYDKLYNAGLIDDTRLGALKIVGRHPWVYYWGAKCYATPDENHIAGLSHDAKQVCEGTWLQDRRIGMRQIPEKGPKNYVDIQTDHFTAGGGD